MSDHSTLSVSFSVPSDSSVDDDHGFVKLEAGESVPYINYLTKAQAVRWMKTFMFGTPPPASNCTGGVGYLIIYAYPSRSGLSYRIGTSKGTLTAHGLEPYEIVEIKQTEFEVELDIGSLPGETVSAIWQGDVFNSYGDYIVARPPTVTSSGTVEFPDPAYGALIVTKRGWRRVYELSIPPDPLEDENSMKAVVYAVWDGGVNGLEVEAPPGTEDDTCNNRMPWESTGDGSTTIIDDDDDDDPWYVSGTRDYHNINYCEDMFFPWMSEGTV